MADWDLQQISHLLRDIASERYAPVAEREEMDPTERSLVRALNQVHRDRETILRSGRNRERLIIDASPVAICVTDEHGYYEYANPVYRRLTGYDESELVGNHFTMVVPGEEQVELSDLHDRFMGRRYELHGEWRIVDKSGRVIPILANAAYIIDIDERPKKVTFVIDISDLIETRRRLEEEVAERVRTEQIRDQVERVMRHDLRNPLDGIRTAAEFLLQEELTERQQEFVRLMREAAMRARSRIDNSLAYARMQRGQYVPGRERINLVQLIRDVVDSLTIVIDAYRAGVVTVYRGVPLSQRYDVELWGEGEFIADAVANLVRNAVEASRPGDRVVVSVDEHDDDPERPEVSIAVTNPAEVPAEIRDRFFEPYVTYGKVDGTGLGTFTARLVAEAHEGTATLTTGNGSTTVELRLPRARPAGDGRAPPDVGIRPAAGRASTDNGDAP